MATWLDEDLTSIAFCWRLDRRDGVTLGFTSHDKDLMIGNLLFRAAPGMVPSAIERSVSLDLDNVDLSGVLTSDAISEADLAAGRWDGARLVLFAANWANPDQDQIDLLRGTLGNVMTAGSEFQVELRGPTAILEMPVIEMTSPDCRAQLGDARCRIDMAGRVRTLTAVSAVDTVIQLSSAVADGLYTFGRLRWLSGANAGLSAAIIANAAISVTLAERPPFAISSGDRIELTEGCDRRFATCRNRFANTLNFQGEPHLPGNDLLTRYAS